MSILSLALPPLFAPLYISFSANSIPRLISIHLPFLSLGKPNTIPLSISKLPHTHTQGTNTEISGTGKLSLTTTKQKMENNIPVMAKKLWSMVRVIYYMVRKGICKRKLLLDLNLMMKRGKIAGKAFGNLLFHRHHHHHPIPTGSFENHRREYEFSCSGTPFHTPFHLIKRNKHRKSKYDVGDKHFIESDDDLGGVSRVLEMMLQSNGNYPPDSGNVVGSETFSSPSAFLPGLSFGKSPMVARQLRITDSPFPLYNVEEDNSHVDEAAEAFIQRFYNQLQRQRSTSCGGASSST